MKKHMSGFVPAKLKQSGYILLLLGVVSLLIKPVSSLTSWQNVSSYFTYFGIGSIVVGTYLIFTTPKEK